MDNLDTASSFCLLHHLCCRKKHHANRSRFSTSGSLWGYLWQVWTQWPFICCASNRVTVVFSFKDAFHTLRGQIIGCFLRSLIKKIHDARHSAAGGCGALRNSYTGSENNGSVQEESSKVDFQRLLACGSVPRFWQNVSDWTPPNRNWTTMKHPPQIINDQIFCTFF